MDVKVTVSTERALRKLKEYERVTGKTIAQSVRNHGRLLGLELMRQAQPFGKDRNAKDSGENAIRKDMNMIFVILNDYWMARFKDAKQVGESLYNKAGEPWITDQYNLVTTISEVKAWLKKNRNPNTGRPSKRGDKTIGRHKAHEYMVGHEKLMEKAKKEVAKAVGWAKAGWAKAAQECKADTKAAFKMTGIPLWIKRHIQSARGAARDKTASTNNPRVTLNSGVRYMSKILSKNQKDAAVNVMRQKWIKSMTYEIKAELKKVKA
jgi:hypothetical protein